MSLQDNLITQRVDECFKELDLKYELDEENDVFRFNFSIDSKLSSVRFLFHTRKTDFWAQATSPIGGDVSDPKMMASLAELVCRINYSLVEGAFNIDFRDGELNFHLAMDTSGMDAPTEQMVKLALFLPIQMWKKYSAAFLAVIFNGKSAKDALDLVQDDD